jgi:hypothetical protein
MRRLSNQYMSRKRIRPHCLECERVGHLNQSDGKIAFRHQIARLIESNHPIDHFERNIRSHIFPRERISAGIIEARRKGTKLGRPLTAAKKASQIWKLHRTGISKAEIARRLDIGRTSVRPILARKVS